MFWEHSKVTLKSNNVCKMECSQNKETMFLKHLKNWTFWMFRETPLEHILVYKRRIIQTCGGNRVITVINMFCCWLSQTWPLKKTNESPASHWVEKSGFADVPSGPERLLTQSLCVCVCVCVCVCAGLCGLWGHKFV